MDTRGIGFATDAALRQALAPDCVRRGNPLGIRDAADHRYISRRAGLAPLAFMTKLPAEVA